MKALLARTGRGGQWASYLRAGKLPRATADRYVAGYEASLKPSAEKCLSEALSEPAKEVTAKGIRRIVPQLRKSLTTHQAVWEFVSALVADLPAAYGDITKTGVQFFPQAPLVSGLRHQWVETPTHPGVVQ
jgi:hypothetical protein